MTEAEALFKDIKNALVDQLAERAELDERITVQRTRLETLMVLKNREAAAAQKALEESVEENTEE
jgi:hypothetical protein